jgi:hypothetical protein
MSPSLNPITGVRLSGINRTSAHNDSEDDSSSINDYYISKDGNITHDPYARKSSGDMPRLHSFSEEGDFPESAEEDDNTSDDGTIVPMTTVSKTAGGSHTPNHHPADLHHQPSALLTSRISLKRGRVQGNATTQLKKTLPQHRVKKTEFYTWRRDMNIRIIEAALGQISEIREGLGNFGSRHDMPIVIDDMLQVSVANLSAIKNNLMRE